MSKSLNNYVGVAEAPDEIFGKIMSISDDLMARWYRVLEVERADSVLGDVASGRLHPRDAKAALAEGQVRRFHGDSAAGDARRRFEERFSKKTLDLESIPEVVRVGSLPREIQLAPLLVEAGLVKSNSEARRLIGQGAVRINGNAVASDRFSSESLKVPGDSVSGFLVEVGKRRALRFRFVSA